MLRTAGFARKKLLQSGFSRNIIRKFAIMWHALNPSSKEIKLHFCLLQTIEFEGAPLWRALEHHPRSQHAVPSQGG